LENILKNLTHEQTKLIIDLHNNLKEEYYFDLFINDFTSVTGTKAKEFYIEATIDYHCKNNTKTNKEKLNRIKPQLKEFSKFDTLISINNKIILKETYTLIFHLHQTKDILSLLKSSAYPKKYFAQYNQDIQEVKREAKRFKKIVIKSRTPLLNKEEMTFKWKMLTLYETDKHMFEYFLNSLVLSDLNKMADVYKVAAHKLTIILDMLSYMTTQKTTPQSILKSIGIILYYKMKCQLFMGRTVSEHLAKSIVENFFNESFSESNINSKIYTRSIVNGLPIFGAKRKSHYTPKHKNIIVENFLKTYKNINNDSNELYDLINKSIDSPQLQHIQKYPIEFFKINPKYQNL